ncbi:MAG: hypothetical protein QXR26_07240 [Candidatus Caldarchaeum sp.]
MDADELLLKHYSSEEVLEEIARFSTGRWVAVFSRDGMHRYHVKKRQHLRIDTPYDVIEILQELKPRSFYATIHTYLWRDSRPVKIISSMASWDVDLLPSSSWVNAMEAAGEIISVLDKLGICKSTIVKWSGEGVHVHVNDRAFSGDLLAKIPPLDAAYALTEYVLRRMSMRKHVLVENKVDPARVFTAPLSLHRALDRVCVCIDPGKLDSFSIEHTFLGRYKHFKDWNRYEVGEADDAVEKAFQAVGPYRTWRKKKRKPSVEDIVRRFHAKFGDEDAAIR